MFVVYPLSVLWSQAAQAAAQNMAAAAVLVGCFMEV
jgi:hypothetical protein